jgi:glycosyltransferase involved in cell wall biosynthesis
MTMIAQGKKKATASSSHRSRVSIGLPVYNGEDYLEQALDSIRAQTYGNFELIISDNASTDGTERICRKYAAIDSRIHYIRQPRNQGISWNWREVVQLSTGEYFLWASHDDVLTPTYIQRCVEVLDQNSNIVLCYSNVLDIDEQGVRRPPKQSIRADVPQPHQRLRELMGIYHNCVVIFGLMRADVLKRTPVHKDFSGADRCLLVEMGLRGSIYRIPEHLFLHREHSNRYTHQHTSQQERTRLMNPDCPPKLVFPYFRLFQEYLACIHRVPLSGGERLRCYIEILKWTKGARKRLLSDFGYAFSDIYRWLRKRPKSAF